MADILIQCGEKPSVFAVRGDEVKESGMIQNKALVPKIYQGRVSWGGHVVCAVGDFNYDPMVGEVMDKESYKNEVFTVPIDLTEAFSSQTLKEMLSRK